MTIALLALPFLPQDTAAFIEDFARDEVATRDRATRAVRSRLPSAEPLLRAGLLHEDAETRARCADLLAELAATRRPPILGRIAFVDEKGERVAVDRRPRDGTAAGDRFEVYRDGRLVGRIEVTEVQAWGSWARPCDSTVFADLQRGDGVSGAKKP